MRLHTLGVLLAWVLWSKVSTVGGSAPGESWQLVSETTTEAQCRALQEQEAERAPGDIPIPGGKMTVGSGGHITRYTYECLPATIDPRHRG